MTQANPELRLAVIKAKCKQEIKASKNIIRATEAERLPELLTRQILAYREILNLLDQ